MKKWLIAVGGVLVLVVFYVYIFIGQTRSVVLIMLAKCNIEGADRMLRDTGNRSGCWPDEADQTIRYTITRLFRRMAELKIDDGESNLPGRLSVFPKVSIDSSVLQLEVYFPTSLNPVSRLRLDGEVKQIQGEASVFLTRLKNNLEDQQKVYGISIRETSTADSMLVERQQVFDQYPSDSAIYVLVGKLQQFIRSHGGRETGYPMFNVTEHMGGTFEVRVALPTDKEMKSDRDVVWRQLIHGKYLEADVRGGDGVVRTAMGQMRNYISDYRRTVMAIPFQSLVTDRRMETDTTKWLTKLYFPIF
jgi:hypothetical protein